MIAKHVPMEKAKKSSFAGLVTYLTGTQDKQERVGAVRTTNCYSDEPDLAMLEVLNTQAQNARSKADKTYHLIVSFRVGEAPDGATLRAIEERICDGIGFTSHQRISIVHHDTDNLHLHIAINKIHPTRYTIQEPFKAYRVLAKLCEKLETEFRLEKDNHQRHHVLSENRAADMERHTGVESLLGWLKRECKSQMLAAGSWEQLHEVMGQNGLQISERANGLVITADQGVTVKASSVGREFSKARLEQRFGAFQPAPLPLAGEIPVKRYGKEPLQSRVDSTALYAKYKAIQAAAATSRDIERASALARKNRRLEAAKRKGRLKRAAIKLLKTPRLTKKMLYAAASKALREEVAAIGKHYRNERQQIYEKHRQRQWGDWLRSQAMAGDQDALMALRAREAAGGLKGNTISGKGPAAALRRPGEYDSVTKKGTIIYRVGASAVRDDGTKLQVSHRADQGALLVALRMASERYGDCIRVNGSAAFREQVAQVAAAANLAITFDDEALERRRQQLTHPLTNKEHVHDNDPRIGRHRDRTGIGTAGRAAAASRAADAAGRGIQREPGHAGRPESHARNAGHEAAPAAGNSVRGLPALGVVHLPERGEVLLPGHVPDRVEHQGAEPDHRVRRDIHRAGRLGEGVAWPASAKLTVKRVGLAPPPRGKGSQQSLAQLQRLSELGAVLIGDRSAVQASASPPHLPSEAALPEHAFHSAATPAPAARATDATDKYVTEREQKRLRFFDIPKHVRYTSVNAGTASYAGIRKVDGECLALLRQRDEVLVLPVDEATASRLRRLKTGAQVSVSSQGVIKKKGRSR
jgi:hypothetical protein